jgi:hypothetical protein
MESQVWWFVQMFVNVVLTAALVTSFVLSSSLIRRLKAEKRRSEEQTRKLEARVVQLEKRPSVETETPKAPETALVEVVSPLPGRHALPQGQDRDKILKLSRLGCTSGQIAVALELPEPGIRLVLKTHDMTRRQWERQSAAAV